MATRNHSIDAFRVIANWVIVCVHTAPFRGAGFSPDVRFCGELFNQFVRIATPFFFLTAGYFFAVSLSRGAEPLSLASKLIKRLLFFFVFWSVCYIAVPTDLLLRTPEAGYWAAVQVMIARTYSWHFLLNGNKVHLWFLPALSCALALLAAACRLRLERPFFWCAAALFLCGLLAGAYQATPVGLHFGLNTRNGPFFSTLFVASGFMIHRLDLQVSQRQALGLIALGVALRSIELLWISGRYGTAPSDIDYLLGTYPFGVGIFLILLKNRHLGEIRWMLSLSRYSAGVYCAHAFSVDLLMTMPLAVGDPFWEIARPFVALALTFALVMLLAKLPYVKSAMT